MAQKKKSPGRPPGTKNKNKKQSAVSEADANQLRKVREIQALVIIAVGIFLAIAMFFSVTGVIGDALGSFFKGCFGVIAYTLPFYLLLYGGLMLAGRTKILSTLSTIFFVVLFFDIAIGNSVRFVDVKDPVVPILGLGDIYTAGTELKNGGVLGMIFAILLVKIIGVAGAYIFAGVVALISVILIADKPYAGMVNWQEKSGERAEKRRIKKEKRQNTETKQLPPVKETEQQLEIAPAKQEIPAPVRPAASVYQPADYKKMGKAIKKARISDSQRKILEYMIDDSLARGKGGESKAEGYGLDGSQESLASPGYGLNDGYSEGDMGHEETGYTGAYENYSDSIDENDNISEKQIEIEVPEENTSFVDGRGFAEEEASAEEVKKPEKISNAQAASATLDAKEFNKSKPAAKYIMPPIDLLKKPSGKGADLTDLAEKTRKLEETLNSFNVDAKVVDAIPGPTVTRYEIHPGPGVKVSSIVGLSNDIALNLEAKSIRIEAPIPGKAAVGIEVENDKINAVNIREIIDSKEFKSSKSKISFAVGKNISGKPVVGDLKGMPHLLIAGSTGSGKSVCINSIIASILYKAKPDEVKLVLVDPKVVELGNYNGIPHLLIPVVTEPTKAAAALNWAVAEMNDRYKKFAEEGERNLEGYNDKKKAEKDFDAVMPQIVIIIDELADLMMAAPSQVEESICRLAQMARAAGMHLIVATQRPSVDVITGVIKANIPSRIAFAVSSVHDSKTIIDMGGAEKLVGKGDMLYNPLGMGKPVRVQGCFISDSEVNSIIRFVKDQAQEVEYSSDVINTIEKTDMPPEMKADDSDELLPDCIELVVQSGQASVSMLQRRFRIGYNRAARIIDMMEERGIVGPQDGSRPRQVFMTEEELHNINENLPEENSDENIH